MDIKLLSQKFCEHSAYIKGFAKPTIRRYRYVLGSYINHSKITEIEQVNLENVRDVFYYGRTARKWSVNTFLNHHKSLSVFFQWCIKEGYMKENPIKEIERPRLEKRLPPKLTKQDALRLLEVVFNYPYEYPFLRFRNHAVFSTFIFAGLRRQELLNLKCGDVDLENLTLFVRQGKGSKDRIIPIPFKLAENLKKYATERIKIGKTCPEFFTSRNHNIGLTDINLKRLVEQIREASGLKFTIHKLRHTFATLMLEGGCDIYSLSRMMGHSDIKTTTIYLAASAEHLRSQMTKHPLNN